jgi:hypothetical protein
MVCLLQMGALQWFHQMGCLWALSGSFCPQGSLPLGPMMPHYQFVQGGQICCFFQAAAELLYTWNSGWSASLPARWDNSVLFTAHSSRISSVICYALALEVWLVTPSPLSTFVPHPAPTCWALLLAPPSFSEVGSAVYIAHTISGGL